MQIETKPTELDVYVDGVRVGWVTDCGDCWRASLFGRRRRRFPDFNDRDEAVRGVVDAVRA